MIDISKFFGLAIFVCILNVVTRPAFLPGPIAIVCGIGPGKDLRVSRRLGDFFAMSVSVFLTIQNSQEIASNQGDPFGSPLLDLASA
jgi:hypothetical protein